jgi:hypothetical protein
VLVRRLASHVELRRIDAGTSAFLAALYAGVALGDALDAALAAAGDFDLEGALSRSFGLGLVVDCTIAAETEIPNTGTGG